MKKLPKFKETPIEEYRIGRYKAFVKREDLCTPNPGPPFSKIRGLLPHLIKLKESGIQTVGYTETTVSMAGWGIAWLSSILGLKCVIFYPQYSIEKEGKEGAIFALHKKMWKRFKAEVIPLKAGRFKVNYYIGRKTLRKYSHSIMLPSGLPLQETFQETAKIARGLPSRFKSIVIVTGSGTICAGVLRGLHKEKKQIVYGVSCNPSVSLERKSQYICNMGGICWGGLFPSIVKFVPIEAEWAYTQYPKIKAPFPCNPFYDLKAWEWLTKNIGSIERPVLFWNVGAGGL